MNKKIFLTTLLFIGLTLSACSFNISRLMGVNSSPGGGPNGGGTVGELPAQTKLILGIINLEETENAITAEQAKELLPMFNVLQDLNESDTAAQEEIDGLVSQIQETLTDAQTQAIDAISLSRQDMFAFIQSSSGGTDTSTAATTGGGGGMGGPPEMGGGGGMPGGGGGMPGGGMPSTGTTSASNGEGTRPAMDTSTPTALFDAIIKLLEKKLQ